MNLSHKSSILQTIIWLDNIDDFAEKNEVWDARKILGIFSVRACGETKLAAPEYKLEAIVVTTLKLK